MALAALAVALLSPLPAPADEARESAAIPPAAGAAAPPTARWSTSVALAPARVWRVARQVGATAPQATDDDDRRPAGPDADAAADADPPAPRSADPVPPRRGADADRAGDRPADRPADRDRSADEPRRRPSAGADADRAGSRPRPIDRGAARRDLARREPCAETAKACEEARKFLRDDDIASVDLDIRVGGRPGNDYPCECYLEGDTFQPRRFASTTMTWKAAGYCHKPLYFEDWELERYGHSRGMFVDPFIAGAHFFVTLPILPYKAGMQAPWECVYPLGYYRPGSCAPWTVPAVPYSARGFATQAATVTGLVFLLP